MKKQPRITPLQAKIVNAHIEAYKVNKFDSDEDKPEMEQTKEEFITKLKDLRTSRGLFDLVKDQFVSVESQLMMSPTIFGIVSGKAQQGITRGFKTFLNQSHINIK